MQASKRSMSRRRWLRRAAWLLALAVVASITVSVVLRRGYGAAALTRRLSASFGRPVSVAGYDFTLLGGPRLEASRVTVGEDPRFGAEYFLRADRLTAGIRWTALLAGRLELDSLVLTRPSLNLVRTQEGQWNLESWLPWPADAPSGAPVGPPAPAVRLRRIRVEGGRINFKRGTDKHPFALVGVDGSFEQAASGEWNIDVEGRPMRAGVVVQEPGAIRVRGQLGGTSARFRPADLRASWSEASLSDALRLITGSDHGVRGVLNVEGQVRAPVPVASGDAASATRWSMAGVLRIAGVHRWDLPSRGGDPAVNLSVEADWWPVLARAEVKRIVVEGPSSEARGSGFVQWGRAPAGYRGSEPSVSAEPDSSFQLVSSAISLNDLFRWYPAFRPDVAPELAVEGNAGLDLQVRGWPPRIERVVMATDGARINIPGTAEFLGVAATVLRYERRRGFVELGPSAFLFGLAGAAPRASLRFAARVGPGPAWNLDSSLAGQAADAGTVLQIASALNMARLQEWSGAGWSLQGPAELRLSWAGTMFPFAPRPQGYVRARNARLSAAFLNEPVELADARLELLSDERVVTLSSVRALGAAWSGGFRQRGASPWQGTLTADTLDAASLRARLAPPDPQTGLLQRLRPGRTASAALLDALRGFRAQGRLTIRQLRLAPLAASQLTGEFTLNLAAPWRFELSKARAAFFGGALEGSFIAEGEVTSATTATYTAELQFRGTNLATLSSGMPRLRGFFTGAASGKIRLRAAGADRAALLASLTGDGELEVRGGQSTLLDLPLSVRTGRAARGITPFARATSRFALAEGSLDIEELLLFARAAPASAPDWRSSGTVAVGGGRPITLDLHVAATETLRPATAPRREFRLTGPLDALEFRPAESPPPRP